MQEKHLYLPSAETINEWKRSLLRVPEQDKNCSTIKQGSTLLAFLLCCHKGQEKLNQAADERNLQEASWDWRNLGSFKQDVQIQEQSFRSPAPPACWFLSALSEIEMFPLLWLAQLPSSSSGWLWSCFASTSFLPELEHTEVSAAAWPFQGVHLHLPYPETSLCLKSAPGSLELFHVKLLNVTNNFIFFPPIAGQLAFQCLLLNCLWKLSME